MSVWDLVGMGGELTDDKLATDMRKIEISDVLCILGHSKVIATDYDGHLCYWVAPYTMRNDESRLRGLRECIVGYEIKDWKQLNDPTVTRADLNQAIMEASTLIRDYRPRRDQLVESFQA
jgi:hypothetical protein